MTPDYKKIYTDLLAKKYPHKQKECEFFFKKERLSYMDVIDLNTCIFGKKRKEFREMDQKYRSYDEVTISKILKYQVENKLNNTQLANHFKLSRTTVAKWKKIFGDYIDGF